MAENKTDRRALKTQKALKESLAEMLTEKELRHITVQEVCDKADIHRVTFYKHYIDIYDLYEKLEEGILDEFRELFSEHGDKDAVSFFSAVFSYIENNPQIFKMICSPNNTGQLYHKLVGLVENLCRQVWEKEYDWSSHGSTYDFIVSYHTNGVIAIIAKWILSGYAQPSEYIIKTISKLDVNTQKIINNL